MTFRRRSLPRLVLLSGLALAGFLGPAAVSEAQPAPPRRPGPKFTAETSHTADALLRNASAHARGGQWAEAIEIYQRVIQQYGEKMAELPRDDPAGDPTGETTLQVDLRLYCQRRLAALPAEARAQYRARVDAQAERLFRQGQADRDRGALRKVVEQMFCSSWGDDALDLLGDLAFQDGRFAEALGFYHQIVPDRPDDALGLVYPDPQLDLARVAAKKLLCRAAMGEADGVRSGLRDLVEAFPGAAGSLGGRSGSLATTVNEILESGELKPPPRADARWPTFAGAATRTRVAPGPIDVGSFQWKVDLDPPASARPSPRANALSMPGGSAPPPERLLAYHPIVLGDQVIVADDRRVSAYNLSDRPSGPGVPVTVAWRHETEGGFVPNAARFTNQVPRHTLTAFGDRIYVRMGQPPASAQRQMGVTTQSLLVALDRSQEGKLLWKRAAGSIPLPDRKADAARRMVGFEGAPVADARNVYVGVTEADALMKLYIACLDAANGSIRWVRYVGSAAGLDPGVQFGMGGMGGFGGPTGEIGQRLLSLDGSTLYYQTNMGAVAALDAETGSIRWVATYPRQERNLGGSAGHRELNPAVVHEGLVLVAPDDSASILAFDAATGRLAWKSDPIPEEVRLAHVLGVARGRLIATGDRVLWFDVKSGKLAATWPDGGRAFEGFGRGLLAGDRVYWPTRGEIHVLDQETGRVTDPPIRLQANFQTSGGNLVAGDGYLIVAQADALVVFCQNSRLIQRYRDEIARAPEEAANYFRLARAAEATGQDELALTSFEQSLAKVRPSETLDGVPLVDATRDAQHRLLLRLGRAARDVNDWDRAAARLEAAASVARAPRDTLTARLELAEVQAERGMPDKAVANLQELLADDRLRSVVVAARDGRRSVRADLLIGDRLAALIDRNGRALYATFDERARDLLERGRSEQDGRLLEEVARAYPVAEVVPQAWLATADLAGRRGRQAEAARAYKRLLTTATDDRLRARALWGLSGAYEAQRLWVPAREALAEALARFPDAELGPEAANARVREAVASRLAQAPFDRMAGDREEPSLPVPLSRLWASRWGGSVRVLAAEGVPPSPEAGRVFLVDGARITPIEPIEGKPSWTADLGGEPIWVGYLADKVVAATATRVVGLGLEKGAVQWEYALGGPARSTRGSHPLARAAAETDSKDSGRLQGFRIVGDRVFCLRGRVEPDPERFVARELMAFDGESGQVEWSYAPSAAAINPHLSIGPERAVLLARGPNAVHVLETATGRAVAAYPRPEAEDWVRDPLPLDDDRVALVVDRRTVALFDLARGAESWTFRESPELPRNGPPRLLGGAEHLLVLHEGNVLIRLDSRSGTRLWSRPLGAKDLSERPASVALDGVRFYCANGQSTLAVRLSDGEVDWRAWTTGPDEGWSVALSETCLLSYPDGRGAPGLESDRLPLVLRRRETGQLVQRLLFPATSPGLDLRLAPRGALVLTEGGLWALGERRAVDSTPSTR